MKSNLIGRFCNTKMPPDEIVSSWNSLLLEFSSDAEVTGRGFALKYASKSFQMPADIQVYDLDGMDALFKLHSCKLSCFTSQKHK